MDDLYREVIIEHYKNPTYRGKLDPHDVSFADNNPLCGDHIQIDLRVGADGIVTDAVLMGMAAPSPKPLPICWSNRSSANRLLK